MNKPSKKIIWSSQIIACLKIQFSYKRDLTEMISVTENKILMTQARESLKGKWTLAIGTITSCWLLLVAIQFVPAIGWIISILISGSVSLGLAIFSLSISRKQDAKFSQILVGFNKFGIGLVAYLFQMIFVILWMLLFIIPGIIASLSYSLTYYIIVDDVSISPLAAIKKSKEMMLGNKWKLFSLQLRFLLLAFLCIFTFGIGFLWLIPYANISIATFYDDIKAPESGNELIQIEKNDGVLNDKPQIVEKMFCLTCKNFDDYYGVCSYLHINVRSYPKQYVKKCNGKYFIEITDKL